MKLVSKLDFVFAGGMGFLEPEGQRSGIFKRKLPGAARVETHGIVGDEHGDPRVHGGPEKAVHHYAAENYARLAQAFPHSAHALVPGSLGENLSASHLCERNVHIGDVFRIGSAIVQVSQPRSPCWKINHRFGAERMSMHVAQQRITGWYYRVLTPGILQAGDEIALLERHTERFSIDRFWQVQLAHRPLVDDLVALAATPGLTEDWKRRLRERVNWLRKLAG
jgi:MOSC domain-containing protein YiiM